MRDPFALSTCKSELIVAEANELEEKIENETKEPIHRMIKMTILILTVLAPCEHTMK